VEKAEGLKPAQLSELSPSVLPIEEVHTPGVKTIDEVCAFLCVKPEEVVKTLIYTYATEGAPVSLLAVLIRGDMEVNEIKVKNRLGCDLLELASDDLILAATGSSRGFAGAIGIKARVIADYSLLGITDCVMGANREEYHLRHVLPGRDFLVPEYADLRVIRENDPCPRCGEGLRFARGIEVGHVFKLGTKYSKSMKANYLDRNGREQTIIMGCYGIGISRTVAAAIEQNHDADGIIWPLPIAPYQVIITPVNVNEQSLSETAEDIYQILLKAGIEVILDDRDERAGVKFKDADLIGIPYRITVGPKKLAEGKVEIKSRRSGTVETLPVAEVESYIMARIREGK
jgi:prolyl-tRNA synthetase